MSRFVILEHRWDGLHWDFMLEFGGILKTWAVDSPIDPGRVQPARPLPDHRLAYLDYEGEISGGRGSVARVDRGVYEAVTWTDRRILIELQGRRYRGRVELFSAEPHNEGPGNAWSFRFEEGNLDCNTFREGSLGA